MTDKQTLDFLEELLSFQFTIHGTEEAAFGLYHGKEVAFGSSLRDCVQKFHDGDKDEIMF